MAEYNFGGGGRPVEILDEAISLTKAVKSIDFVGPSVVASTIGDDVTVTIGETARGTIIPFTFLVNGNTANKWLGVYESSHPSNILPLTVKQSADLKGWSFMNVDDDVDIDIEVYKNGTLGTTFNVRNKRWEYDVGISSISFAQGDRISVFLKKYTGGSGDTTAQDPRVVLMLKVNNEAAGSGGAQYGV